MPFFDWANFWDLAQHLEIFGKDNPHLEQAAFRTAVSRAYYAAFGVVREYAVNKNAPEITGTYKDHRGVIEFLKKYNAKIGTKLSKLQSWRKDSDYEDMPVSSQKVENALTYAKEVIDWLRKNAP